MPGLPGAGRDVVVLSLDGKFVQIPALSLINNEQFRNVQQPNFEGHLLTSLGSAQNIAAPATLSTANVVQSPSVENTRIINVSNIDNTVIPVPLSLRSSSGASTVIDSTDILSAPTDEPAVNINVDAGKLITLYHNWHVRLI